MSDTVLGWLFSGWVFASSDRAGPGRRSPPVPEVENAGSTNAVQQQAIGGIAVSELLRRLREDDRDALSMVYQALAPLLWRVASLRLQSVDLASEVVHDTFLALWHRRHTLPEETDLHVYLMAAVRNRTRDVRKHDDVITATEVAVHDHALKLPGSGTVPLLPDVALENAEFMEAFSHALTVLSPGEREAILLRWDQGFTFERIGLALGISKKGAQKMVLRAQAKVQRLLASFDPRS